MSYDNTFQFKDIYSHGRMYLPSISLRPEKLVHVVLTLSSYRTVIYISITFISFILIINLVYTISRSIRDFLGKSIFMVLYSYGIAETVFFFFFPVNNPSYTLQIKITIKLSIQAMVFV